MENMMFVHSTEYIEKLNSGVDTWHATHYSDFRFNTYGDMLRKAGGKRSRIARCDVTE